MEANATVNFTASDIEEMMSQESCLENGENVQVFSWTVKGTKRETINLIITVGDD